MGYSVDEDLEHLKIEIKRLGQPDATNGNKLTVPFGVLFKDERCANLFEALLGTLKAAKKRKIVHFDGDLLLQGVHDKVNIVLLQE